MDKRKRTQDELDDLAEEQRQLEPLIECREGEVAGQKYFVEVLNQKLDKKDDTHAEKDFCWSNGAQDRIKIRFTGEVYRRKCGAVNASESWSGYSLDTSARCFFVYTSSWNYGRARRSGGSARIFLILASLRSVLKFWRRGAEL
jgi:hypothetical protein